MKGSPAVPPPRVPRTDGCPGLLVGPQRCPPGPAPCGGLWRRPGCMGAVSGWACGRSRCPLGGHTALLLRRWGDEGGAPGWKTGALSSCRWAGTPQEWAATAPLRWGCGIPVHTQPRPAAPSGGREVGGGRRTLSPELSCWTQRTAALPAAPEWGAHPSRGHSRAWPPRSTNQGRGCGQDGPQTPQSSRVSCPDSSCPSTSATASEAPRPGWAGPGPCSVRPTGTPSPPHRRTRVQPTPPPRLAVPPAPLHELCLVSHQFVLL